MELVGLKDVEGTFTGTLDVEGVAFLVGPEHRLVVWDTLERRDLLGWFRVAWAKLRRKRDPRILYEGDVELQRAEADDGAVAVWWQEPLVR